MTLFVSISPLLAAQAGSTTGNNTTLLLLIGFIGVLVCALVGVVVFTKILLPRRRRKPLIAAIELLESGDKEELREAESQLVGVLTVGLRKRDLADARFALTYVRAMLEKYQEAATTVAELRGTNGENVETLYLDLWLQAKLENHDSVRELYEENTSLLDDLLQTKLIASISYLHKARERWRAKEVEGALHLFELIRTLGQLTEQLPEHVDDLQIVNGIQAVFDGRLADARQSFEGAKARAEELRLSTAEAELGLIVCTWKSEEIPDVDDIPGQVLDSFDQNAPELENNEPAEASDDETEIEPDEGPGEEPERELDESIVIRANAALLHAISLLFVWLATLPANKKLPANEHKRLRQRVGRVLAYDPDLADALLIQGLIDYYFAASDDARREAIDVLEKGTQKSKAILLPEVIDLIERERRLDGDRLDRYLSLVRSYLTDGDVPVAMREKLRRRLLQKSFSQEIGEIEVDSEERNLAPSVDDIRHRGDLLLRRIESLVRPHASGADDLDNLLKSLKDTITGLTSGVSDLEQTEYALVLQTGEFLLLEDVQEEPKKSKGKPPKAKRGPRPKAHGKGERNGE